MGNAKGSGVLALELEPQPVVSPGTSSVSRSIARSSSARRPGKPGCSARKASRARSASSSLATLREAQNTEASSPLGLGFGYVFCPGGHHLGERLLAVKGLVDALVAQVPADGPFDLAGPEVLEGAPLCGVGGSR